MEEKKKIDTSNILSTLKKLFNDLLVEPFYILTHPIKGFYEFKTDKLAKNYVAVVYIVLLCFTKVLGSTQSGYLVDPYFDIGTYNIIVDILYIIVPVLIGVIANWSITTLFDGKGKLADIFRVVGYAACPYVLLTIPNIIYSNFIVEEELVFYIAIGIFSAFLFGYMIFFGLLGVHEYGLFKTILTIVSTLISVGVILFFIFVMTTLFSDIYSFVKAVIDEFTMRYL